MGISSMKIQRTFRRRSKGLRLWIMTGVFLFGILILFPLSLMWRDADNGLGSEKENSGIFFLAQKETLFGRKLLASNETEERSGVYPQDAFTEEQRKNGAVILHVFGMVYMFVALAIVCDEFFVPSLGVITDKLQISEDVAGATFMAAGGSAPELFISIFGVFLTRDNVGIGTIVGSAVFNILFVIGMCALFSKTVLALTWWPLFRDVTFYSIDLILLICFFLDRYIDWWEALILLLCYAAYVIFMKFNHHVEKWVKAKLNRKVQSKVKSTDNLLSEKPQRTCSLPILKSGSAKFRHGVLQLMIHTIDPLGEGKIHEKAQQLQAVTHYKSEQDELQNHKDPNSDDPDKQLGFTNQSFRDDYAKDSPVHAISNGKLDFNGHTVSTPERNASQHTTMTSVESVNKGYMQTDRPLSAQQPVAAEDGGMSVHCSSAGTRSDRPDKSDSTSRSSSASESREDLEDESEPLDLSWPPLWKQRITYVLVIPLVFLLWLTLPDVRRPEKRKWYPVTFIGSILWIGGFSFLMIWWAHVTGETMGISEEIMGLTILAAGTSVPDLITSVIVAKKGYGDMAVSSSVGSNIFDITVGLPFPWLLSNIIYGTSVNVDSKGLVCSIVLLFLMLMAVIGSIAAFKWRMSKLLGLSMFLLYLIFITLSVLLELTYIICPVIV
ncbi:sodium/potassium/calcium exchanger 2-like [Liolophura sinensis]|uniref:sodium/potassium/calcium exchanger 2-like n=1 Tax=Liolophura sinensis TaxID=3198878 RepID=UPI00315910FD